MENEDILLDDDLIDKEYFEVNDNLENTIDLSNELDSLNDNGE